MWVISILEVTFSVNLTLIISLNKLVPMWVEKKNTDCVNYVIYGTLINSSKGLKLCLYIFESQQFDTSIILFEIVDVSEIFLAKFSLLY